MEPLVVNPAKLADTAAAVERAAKEIDELIAALDAETAALRSLWSGEAQRAFDRAQAHLRTGATRRATAATEISHSLRTLAETYSDADLDGSRRLGPS